MLKSIALLATLTVACSSLADTTKIYSFAVTEWNQSANSDGLVGGWHYKVNPGSMPSQIRAFGEFKGQITSGRKFKFLGPQTLSFWGEHNSKFAEVVICDSRFDLGSLQNQFSLSSGQSINVVFSADKASENCLLGIHKAYDVKFIKFERGQKSVSAVKADGSSISLKTCSEPSDEDLKTVEVRNRNVNSPGYQALLNLQTGCVDHFRWMGL
jgi:hypothetical protein